MQDHDFTSRSNEDEGKPYFYVFIKGDEPIGHIESRFFRFDTAPEAAALHEFLQTEHPDSDYSLGVHKPFTRRADIIERIDGANVLSDSVARTSPWKDDPAVRSAASNLAKRLGVTWRIDRELAGVPVLVPNEAKSDFLPPYFDGKFLCPDVPDQPQTSIQEVFVQTLGWMSVDGLKSVAKHPGHGNPAVPAVSQYLVAYQVEGNGFRGTATISPADFETMKERYLAQLEKNAPQKAGDERKDLDTLKREAKARTQSKPRPISHVAKAYDHAL